MKKTLIVLAVFGGGASVVQAQPSVTLYGLMDTTIRYSTNDSPGGDHKFEMTDGVLTGSRWGLRGTEDLGDGYRAIFTLESGFSPTTGTSLQGGRLFGRQAYVGLSGPQGTLALGRQYTIAHEVMAGFESMAFANNSIVGYEGGPYTGLRYDNTLKYTVTFSGLTVSAAHTFGNVAGNFKSGAAEAASLVYRAGPLKVGAVYQVTYNVSSAYFNAVSAAQQSTQRVVGLGGTYTAGPAILYLGYMHNRLDVADITNNDFFAGVNYSLTSALKAIATLHYDKLKRAGDDGKRWTGAFMLDYFLSKRTDIYAEVDYTKLSGAWVALNSSPSFVSSANTYGNNNRTGVMLGVRHTF